MLGENLQLFAGGVYAFQTVFRFLPAGYLFGKPENSNQSYNGYLKEIADVCGIKYLAAQMSRHTFVTTILLEQDLPIETISQLLGHRSIRTTQIYATDKQSIVDQLGQICDREGIGFEDWTTVRILCKQCSEGIPHEQHDHDNESLSNELRTFGFAAIDKGSIERILQEWSDSTDTKYSDIMPEME